MNATKRKFNALLNGMGNKATTSPSATNNASLGNATSTGGADGQKRRRISDSTSITNQDILQSKMVASTRSSAAIHHKKSTSLATAALSQETPKYAPWDRAEFLKRLKSFSNLTDWTPKPARVNEVEWAKRGWVCQKFERVRCCLCNVEILVKLNRKDVDSKEEPVYVAQNIEDALVDKYVELIITSHEENCLWRKRGCDDSIFKLPLNHAPTTLQTLHERYEELCARNDTLPYMFNLRTPPELNLDTVLSYLPKDFFASPTQKSQAGTARPADVNRVAFLMSMFGWQGHTHERLGVQIGSVSCQACFRILGLWLFKSKQVNDIGEEVVGAAVSCLDVVKEHREYCPWRNPASQNGQKATENFPALAGWAVVLRVVKNNHHLRTSGDWQTTKTPKRVMTQMDEADPLETEVEDGEDTESTREENDKKRWARLRRVKSLFNTTSSKKLSRPETAKSKTRT